MNKKIFLIFILVPVLFYNCLSTPDSDQKSSVPSQQEPIQLVQEDLFLLNIPEQLHPPVILDTDIYSEMLRSSLSIENADSADTQKKQEQISKLTENQFNQNSDTEVNQQSVKAESHSADSLKKLSSNNQVKQQRILKMKKPEKYKGAQLETALVQNGVEDKNLDLTNLEKLNVQEKELKQIKALVGQEISISLQNPDWLIKEMDEDVLYLLKRQNFEKATLFQFYAQNSGSSDLVFIRYDYENSNIYRQPFSVNIIAKSGVNQSEVEELMQANPEKADSQQKNGGEEEDQLKQIAHNYYETGHFDEAKGIYLDLIDNGETDGEVLYRMGMIENQSANISLANQYFDSVIADPSSPFYIDGLYQLINNLKKEKKFSEALNYFYQNDLAEFKNDPRVDDLYLMLPDIFFSMRDYKNASMEYKNFITLFNESDNLDKAHFYLGYSLENMGYNPDYKEAVKNYKYVIDNFPESDYYQLSKNRVLYLERHYLRIY